MTELHNTPESGSPRAVARRLVQPSLLVSLLALGLALVGLMAALTRAVDTSLYREDDAWLFLLALVGALPLVAVMRWPLLTLVTLVSAVSIEALAGYQVIGSGYWAAATAVLIVAVFGEGRSVALGGLVAVVGLIVVFAADRGDISWGSLVATWAFYSFIYTLGIVVRIYRATATRAESRAALFAADRGARAREAVANERARLARELHDSVGHALNVVVLQAGGAQRILATKPERAGEALAAIETAGRQALADIERVLGILRERGDEDAFDAQPRFAQLDVLVERVRAAGLPVELHVEGEPRRLAPSMDLSAYRIVQEALTNTIKHAGRAHAWIAVRWADDHLDIEALDDGRGAAPPSEDGGRGLVGIRERVLLFGGQFAVGPRPEGGFGVWARLPLDAPGRPSGSDGSMPAHLTPT